MHRALDKYPEPNWTCKTFTLHGKTMTLPPAKRVKPNHRALISRFIKLSYEATNEYRDVLWFYLNSFKGKKPSQYLGALKEQKLSRYGYLANDTLAERGKDYFQKLKIAHYDPESHLPLAPSKYAEIHKYVGIEIECISPYTMSQIKMMYKARPRKIKNFRIGTDGSVNVEDTHPYAYEFRLLTRIDDPNHLLDFCAFLAEIKAKANKSCGLHVHIDARGPLHTPVRIIRNLKHALPFLISMVPHVRRSGHTYCLNDVPIGKHRHSKYSKINVSTYKRLKTIEVRMHSGTVQYNKISKWVKILHSIAMSEHLKKVPNPCLEFYAEALGWDEKLKSYCERRIEIFKNCKIQLVQYKNNETYEKEIRNKLEIAQHKAQEFTIAPNQLINFDRPIREYTRDEARNTRNTITNQRTRNVNVNGCTCESCTYQSRLDELDTQLSAHILVLETAARASQNNAINTSIWATSNFIHEYVNIEQYRCLMENALLRVDAFAGANVFSVSVEPTITTTITEQKMPSKEALEALSLAVEYAEQVETLEIGEM